MGEAMDQNRMTGTKAAGVAGVTIARRVGHAPSVRLGALVRRMAAVAAGLSLLAGCASTPAAVPSAGSSAAAPVSIRTSINGTSPSTVFEWVTKDTGIFAKHGLDVSLTAMAGTPAMNALISGDIDFAVHAGPQLVLSAYANGTPLKVVAAFDHVYDLKLVVPSNVTSLDQLRGKKLATPDLSAENGTAAISLLRERGLEPGRDYQVIQTGSQGSSAGVVAQLLTHQVDASALQQTFADQAVAQGGYHVLVDLADSDVRIASQIMTFPADFVAQRPDVVQRIVDSLVEGLRYFKEHPNDAVTAMRVHYRMDDQAQMEALYQRQIKLLAKEPTIAKEDLAVAAAELPKDLPRISDDRLAALVDNRFVQSAIDRGLTNY